LPPRLIPAVGNLAIVNTTITHGVADSSTSLPTNAALPTTLPRK
jgi:hypothetical protein